jgi:branched-chain amino acid transport system permease protein
MAAAGPLLDSFWQSLLTIVFFYALMGLTWNLMMSTGLLSLGQGLFLGLGAYPTAVFTATGGLSPWISILIGAAVSAMAGSAIAWIGGRFSVRGVQFALLTIAFAELARVLFDNWDFVGSTGGFFLKAINPDTNRPLLTLRGGTLFFYLAFVLITPRRVS